MTGDYGTWISDIFAHLAQGSGSQIEQETGQTNATNKIRVLFLDEVRFSRPRMWEIAPFLVPADRPGNEECRTYLQNYVFTNSVIQFAGMDKYSTVQINLNIA